MVVGTVHVLGTKIDRNKGNYCCELATCSVSSKEHGNHSHEKAMEMDRARAQKKTRQHHMRNPPFDTRRKEEKRRTPGEELWRER